MHRLFSTAEYVVLSHLHTLLHCRVLGWQLLHTAHRKQASEWQLLEGQGHLHLQCLFDTVLPGC